MTCRPSAPVPAECACVGVWSARPEGLRRSRLWCGTVVVVRCRCHGLGGLRRVRDLGRLVRRGVLLGVLLGVGLGALAPGREVRLDLPGLFLGLAVPGADQVGGGVAAPEPEGQRRPSTTAPMSAM